MSYSIYLNNILLPVTPPSVEIESEGKNDSIELIDGSEINVLKKPGLKTIRFECRLPQDDCPYAVYEKGFMPAQYYIDQFGKLQENKTPFQFILNRLVRSKYRGGIETSNINSSYDTNIKVAIENMGQNEDADNGFDIILDMELREYVDYSTKTFEIKKEEVVEIPPERPVDPPPPEVQTRIYLVRGGDSLWAIAARELGDGSRYKEIASKNNIADPNRIQPGQSLDLTGL